MARYRALLSLAVTAVLLSCSDGPTEAPQPARAEAVSGGGQTATVATRLPSPLVVKVTDARGKPIRGTTIAWAVTEGGGSVSAQSSTTDAAGEARVEWTLGPRVGPNVAAATVTGLAPVTFAVTGTAGAAARVEKLGGEGQTGTAGGPLSDSLVVRVADVHGNPVSGAMVTWSATSGGGSVSPASGATDAAGTAKTRWTTGRVAGANAVTAAADGAAPVTFSATGRAGAPDSLVKVSGDGQTATAGTALASPLVARVADANGNPVAGVTVTWQVAGGGGSLAPAIAFTDATGLAQTIWTLGTTAGANSATASAIGATLSFGSTGVPGSVATVSVLPASPSIQVGGTVDLATAARDAAGNAVTGRPVSWSTSSAAVASVSAAGVVTGVSAGSATITATVDGKVGTATVTVVPVPVASVEVAPGASSIQVGGTVDLGAVARDAAGRVLTGRGVTWSTSAPSVASVSGTGVVTGVAPGSATITAHVEGKSGAAAVAVTPVPVASVAVSPSAAVVPLGGTQQYSATLRDAPGNTLTGRSVAWNSSNPAVATVSASGLVTGQMPGSATITAESEGRSGSAAVVVDGRSGTDSFAAGTLAGYTQHFDVAAEWSIAGGVLTARGGNAQQSVLIRNGSSVQDGWVEADLDRADQGGLVLRFRSNADYYLLMITDDGSALGSRNVEFHRRRDGSFQLLSYGRDISWPRGERKRVRFVITGNVLAAYVDGVLVHSFSDPSPLTGAGAVGMRFHDTPENPVPDMARYLSFGWASF